MFHVPPFNASDVFFPSYATSSSSDSDHDGGPDRCASLPGSQHVPMRVEA